MWVNTFLNPHLIDEEKVPRTEVTYAKPYSKERVEPRCQSFCASVCLCIVCLSYGKEKTLGHRHSIFIWLFKMGKCQSLITLCFPLSFPSNPPIEPTSSSAFNQWKSLGCRNSGTLTTRARPGFQILVNTGSAAGGREGGKKSPLISTNHVHKLILSAKWLFKTLGFYIFSLLVIWIKSHNM